MSIFIGTKAPVDFKETAFVEGFARGNSSVRIYDSCVDGTYILESLTPTGVTYFRAKTISEVESFLKNLAWHGDGYWGYFPYRQ